MVPALLFLVLFAGCARHTYEPSASPTYSNKAMDGRTVCESAGGTWNALTHFCDLAY